MILVGPFSLRIFCYSTTVNPTYLHMVDVTASMSNKQRPPEGHPRWILAEKATD